MNKKQNTMISADCICDLPADLQRELKVSIMYCYIKTEEARFLDTSEMTAEDLFEYIDSGRNAESSCVSVEEYREYFQKLRCQNGLPIIHIATAKDVSNGYYHAFEAAKELEEVYVFDSGKLSGGTAMLVLMAADMARKGAGSELILQRLHQVKDKVSTSFVVDSTKYLHRNMRITSQMDMLCSTLSLHPIIKLENSQMKVKGMCVGSLKKYARSYIRKMLRHKKKIRTEMLFVITAGCSFEVQEFIVEELKKQLPWERIVIGKASATISCNSGPGVFGFMFMYK